MDRRTQNTSKLLWIENIRAYSIVAVITIHSIYSALLLFGEDSLTTTGISIYRSLMNLMWWGVPCFLMITGYLLLNPEKEIGYEKILKKYIPRMLAVLLIFGTVFAWMELFFADRSISVHQIAIALLKVFEGETWAHLWYVYCLIGIYLLLPVYRILAKNMSDKDLKYYLVVNFIFISAVRLIEVFGVQCGFYIHVLTIYPFWLFMGLAFKREALFLSRRNSIMLLCASTALLVILTIAQYLGGASGLSVLFGYDSPFVVAQAIAIFNLIREAKTAENLRPLMQEVGDKSFGIYLVHMFFVNVFYKVLDINPFSKWGVLLVTLIGINLVLSYTCTWILKKLPLFRKIL